MKRPCPIAITCPGIDAPEPDWPVINVSAEAPDPILFTAVVWPDVDPYRPRCLYQCNPDPDPVNCADIIQLTDSQELANMLATAAGLICPPLAGGACTFVNDAQSATVTCPDGSQSTFTVPAGTMLSGAIDCVLGAPWMEMANAWARSYAYQQASDALKCAIRPFQPPRGGGDSPGPTIADNPGWCCLGDDLIPEFNTYNISGAGSESYTFTLIAGAFPPGTDLIQTGPHTAVLIGTPTTPGVYHYTIQAASADGTRIITIADTFYVIGITNTDLPPAVTGTPYGPEQLNATGGTAPFTFSSNDLPSGFSLSGSGLLTSDNSITPGDYTFSVTVTDAEGASCSQQCSISVVAPACQLCGGDWIDPGGCAVSSNPPWDGSFPLQTVWSPPNNYPMWYFVNQSIAGQAAAASDGPNYPGGDWQNLDLFTQLSWDGTQWLLLVACSSGAIFWAGTGTSVDPGDPTGTYTFFFGSNSHIGTVEIVQSSGVYCLSVPVPASMTAGAPTQVRIRNYASILASFGNWCTAPGCGNLCATVEPVWTGTFPSRVFPNPTTLTYLSENPPVVGFNIANAKTEARVGLVPSLRWELDIGVLLGGVSGWYGVKTCGASPIGTYTRLSPSGSPGDPGGCSPGPNTITIESY